VTRFLNQVTQALNNVFKFEGTLNSLSRIDLVSDIQPVFDLSYSSGLAKGADSGSSQGFGSLRASTIHVGAGTLHNQIPNLTQVESDFLNIPLDQIAVWLMDIAFWTTPGIMTVAQTSVSRATIEGTIQDTTAQTLIALADTEGILMFAGGVNAAFRGGGPVMQVPFPLYLLPGTNINFSSLATGAGTIAMELRFWVGPRYMQPPKG